MAERATRESVPPEHVRFSRREVREHTSWGHTQVKVHMQRLEELEYVHVHRGVRGQSFVYALAAAPVSPSAGPATSTTQKWSGWSGGGRPLVGGGSGGETDLSSEASAPYLSGVGAEAAGVVGGKGDRVVGARSGAASYANGPARAVAR